MAWRWHPNFSAIITSHNIRSNQPTTLSQALNFRVNVGKYSIHLSVWVFRYLPGRKFCHHSTICTPWWWLPQSHHRSWRMGRLQMHAFFPPRKWCKNELKVVEIIFWTYRSIGPLEHVFVCWVLTLRQTLIWQYALWFCMGVVDWTRVCVQLICCLSLFARLWRLINCPCWKWSHFWEVPKIAKNI